MHSIRVLQAGHIVIESFAANAENEGQLSRTSFYSRASSEAADQISGVVKWFLFGSYLAQAAVNLLDNHS